MRTDLPVPFNTLPRAEAEAARWLVLRRDGAMTAHDEREYRVWLDLDPSHRAAAAKIERHWHSMGAIGDDPEIMALTERRARQSNRRPQALRAAMIAAGVLTAAIGGWGLRESGLIGGSLGIVSVQEQTFRTSVGQRTTVTLPDGSIVTLDTDSLMRTRENGRERVVELERGRAFFRVAKDVERPFVVIAAGKTVTATGTQFAVDIDPGVMSVTLAEGRVRVEEPREQFRRARVADLRPGWRLMVEGDNPWKTTRVDLEREMSWTNGRLHFFNDRLGDAAAEMNRYSEKKIVIRDPRVAAQPIVGNFRAGDVDGFVRAARLHGVARVKVETDDVVELGAL